MKEFIDKAKAWVVANPLYAVAAVVAVVAVLVLVG